MDDENLFNLQPCSLPEYCTRITTHSYIAEVLTPRNFVIYVLVKESCHWLLSANGVIPSGTEEDSNEHGKSFESIVESSLTSIQSEPQANDESVEESHMTKSEEFSTDLTLQVYIILWNLLTEETSDLVSELKSLHHLVPAVVQSVFQTISSFTNDDVLLEYVDPKVLGDMFSKGTSKKPFSVTAASVTGLFLRKFAISMQMLSLENVFEVAQSVMKYSQKLKLSVTTDMTLDDGTEAAAATESASPSSTPDILTESQVAQFAHNISQQLAHNAQLNTPLMVLDRKLQFYASRYPHVAHLHYARHLLSLRTHDLSEAQAHLRRYFEWHSLTLQTTGYAHGGPWNSASGQPTGGLSNAWRGSTATAGHASSGGAPASGGNRLSEPVLAALSEEMINHFHTHTAYRHVLSAAVWSEFGFHKKSRQLEQRAMEEATRSQSALAYEHIASLRNALCEQDVHTRLGPATQLLPASKSVPEITFSNMRATLWSKLVQGDSVKEILQLSVRMFLSATSDHALLLLVYDLARVWAFLGFKSLSVSLMLCCVNMASMQRVAQREEFVATAIIDVIQHKASAGYHDHALDLLDTAERVIYPHSEVRAFQQARLEMQAEESLLRRDYEAVERALADLHILAPFEAQLRRVTYEKELGDLASAVRHCEALVFVANPVTNSRHPTAVGGTYKDLQNVERELRARLLLVECELLLSHASPEAAGGTPASLPSASEANLATIEELSSRHHLFSHLALGRVLRLVWQCRSCRVDVCAQHRGQGEFRALQRLRHPTALEHFHIGFLLGKGALGRHLRARWVLLIAKWIFRVEVLPPAKSITDARLYHILRLLNAAERLLQVKEVADEQRLFDCLYMKGLLFEALQLPEDMANNFKKIQPYLERYPFDQLSKWLNAPV